MSVLSELSFLSVSANRQNDKNDNLRTYNFLWYLVILTMSNMLNVWWLNQFYQPSFHRPHIHSKDFGLLHRLLFRKVRGKHFLLYLCSQNGSQAATLIKGFIYLLTLAVIIYLFILFWVANAPAHSSNSNKIYSLNWR